MVVIRFLRRLWPLLGVAERRRIQLAVAGSVLLGLLDALGVGLVLPLVQIALSDVSDGGSGPASALHRLSGIEDPGTLAACLAAAVVAVFVAKGVVAVMLLRGNIRTALDAEYRMADRLVRGYLAAPLRFHLERNSAEVQRNLTESLRRVYQEALATAVPALGDRAILLAIGLVLTAFAPIEAAVGALWFAGVVRVYRRLTAARVSASSADLVDESRRSLQQMQQALVSVREVAISGRAREFAESILESRRRSADRLRVIALTEQLPRYYLEMGLIGGAAVVSAVAFLSRDTPEALATLGLFFAAGLRVLPSLNRALNSEGKVRVAIPNLAAIERDLAAIPDPDEADLPDPEPIPAEEPFRDLLVASVRFAYSPSAPVFTDLNLDLRAGECIGVVGGSGVGKSTLIGLILGLLEPDGGEISVNGRSLGQCRKSWQHRLGYVPQLVSVLDTSVIENVAFGVPRGEIEEDRVRTVLEAAQLSDFVAGLPEGWNTALGEDGARISGGQRQRLGLARALYGHPSLLVLDEATSALDRVTEGRVLDTVNDLRGQVTILIVSHRHSAIRDADRIVHLGRGGVVAIGTYADLLIRDRDFAVLADAEE